MHKRGAWIAHLSLALVIAGCARASMAIGGAGVPAAEQGTAEPAATAAAGTPTPAPSEMVEVDSCLACHSDKQQLIDTAKEEEVVPEESSGVG
jgi:hypothetical protein